jgi:hypothetical protein
LNIKRLYKSLYMEYICRHCGVDLDLGDAFEYFLLEYNDREKAMQIARQYGWSETNKVHFNGSIIIQSETCSQYTICSNCEEKDPFQTSNNDVIKK